MSLVIYGEDGKQVTDDNPLVTEHDGEQGEAVDMIVTLKNETDNYTFKRVRVEALSGESGVRVYIARYQTDLDKGIIGESLPDFPPKSKFNIAVRVIVPPGTDEAVLKKSFIRVKSMRFAAI
jgi:hypothetical protein